MNDIPGKIIGILLAFVLCVIMPFINVVVQDEMVNRRLVTEDIASFIDSITDGRVMSEADVKAFEAKLSSYGVLLDYDVTRYARSVNPDPASPSSDYYVTYVEMPNNKTYNKGDKVSIHVYQVSSSGTENLAQKLSGLFIRDFDVTITARVR